MVGDTLSPVQLMSVRLFLFLYTQFCCDQFKETEAFWIGRSAHGYNGPTVELSAWAAHYAALS